MWLLVPLLLQSATAQVPDRSSGQGALPIPQATYELLRAEHARGAEMRSIDAALISPDSALQRAAARAVGRFEQPQRTAKLIPLLTARAVTVRREAVNALGQMRSRYDLTSLLAREHDASVRAVIYETIGRIPADSTLGPSAVAAANAATATRLAAALRDSSEVTREGAARGLESLLRRTAKSTPPTVSTIRSIRDAVRDHARSETRQLLLLALTAANDRDSITTAIALRDSSAEVRRVAVAMSRRWTDDRAPMVRWQALKVAGNCARASALARDSSDHVALLALDVIGEQRCADAASRAALEQAATAGRSWRHTAHALVSMAHVAPVRARALLPRLSASPVWQARTYAAKAARMVGDSATLRTLAVDSDPNVAIAAMHTTAQALHALDSDHAGLVLAGATQLKGSATLPASLPKLRESFTRLTAVHRVTLRDPRVALLERIGEVADGATIPWLYDRLRDDDPAVAALAARVLTARTRTAVTPSTTRYVPPAFPAAEQFAGLIGATATMIIQGVGTVELALNFMEAPMAVYTFAGFAATGKFNGLTFHRIVPNFVIQGGSPGADEYDPITDTFMRDEVGLARQARGSFGISTRGRDTGDGQIYINLVNNFRLDHDYTVFANVLRGLDVVDRVQEGDVIESVIVHRSINAAIRRP